MIQRLNIFLLLAIFSITISISTSSTAAKKTTNRQSATPSETTLTKSTTNKKNKSKSAKKNKKKRSKGCQRYTSPQYKKMKRRWQKVPSIPKPKWKAGYRDLTLYSVNLGKRIRIFPFLPDGTLDPEALAAIETVLADKHTKNSHPVDPRLVKLMYKLADRFEARQINIVSGFREPKNATGRESHHSNGSAVDLMIPGVKLAAVAKVARRYGHVGIGYYPTSGFVHIDVRKGVSYFWADPSGPGKPSCMRQIMKTAGFKFDRKWKSSQDEPKLHKNKKGELLGALEPEEVPSKETSQQNPSK